MKLFSTWRKQRHCFHHDRITGDTWILSRLINLGAGKMLWCRECGRTWFV